MVSRQAVARALAAPEEWNRRRLQVFVCVAGLVCLAVLVGAIWAVAEMLSRDGREDRAGTATAIAGGMQDVTIEDAQPGELSERIAGTIDLPQPRSLGAVQVPTGFPRTAAGAMAQLVAIDQRAIQSVSVVTAQQVISGWAAAGGPTGESWSGVEAVRTLLESAGLPANESTDMIVELKPAMGLLQDAAADRVTPCVDFILTVTAQGGAADRIAVADCQHMVWRGRRWVIASGEEVEPTASLWPGTEASYDAGYQWLEVSP
jgi:hypothetical protein